MDSHGKHTRPRRSALIVIAVIALLILGFIAWNRYEMRDGGDAAIGPAAWIDAAGAVATRMS